MTLETLKTQIIVGTRNMYNDNDGPFSIAYYLSPDRKQLLKNNYSNGYNNVAHDAITVNASDDDIELARTIYVDTKMSIEDRDTIIGCTVKLARARKAPNNTELLIIGYHEAKINRYNQHQPAVILVKDTDEDFLVHESSIKEFVKGALPIFF